jgi:branched-chain amino acid transport system substrate-binding protein
MPAHPPNIRFRGVKMASAADSDTKVCNIVRYTGQFSEQWASGHAEAVYFRMINDQYGINGHAINFISRDSDSSKSVALAR